MISHAILKLLIAETVGPCASAPARVNVMADITHTHNAHTHTRVYVRMRVIVWVILSKKYYKNP